MSRAWWSDYCEDPSDLILMGHENDEPLDDDFDDCPPENDMTPSLFN